MAVRVRLLGPLEVVDSGGRAVDLGARKERIVLAMLAVSAGAPVSDDALIDLLWDDDPPPSARKSVQVMISRLRKSLAAVGDVSLETIGNAYRLVVPDGGRDIDIVERQAASAATAAAEGDHDTAVQLLTEAIAEWRGPALGEARDVARLRGQVAGLDDLHISLIERRIDSLLAIGRHAEVAAELEVLCGEHPFREALWAARLVALYRSGRQADALRAYREVRELLLDELGVDPGPELQSLETRILQQDPGLDWVAPPVSPASSSGPDGVAGAPVLPSGTVTFCFTDIEASTRLFQALGDGYATVQAAQRDIVADAITEAGGVVVQLMGDGVFAAFAGASDALAGALVAQQRLREADFGPGGEVRVRMGLHSAEATPKDGDYIALGVHQASRVTSAAHGGQVVASDTTAALAASRLPSDARLVDLGEHRLRDFDVPQRLYQLDHPSIAEIFPALRVPSVAGHNLPASRTSFVGRDVELADLSKLLESNRLVSLVGPGGAGKTRLGTELALHVRDRFADGVWLAELGSEVEPSRVAAAVAVALGLPDDGGDATGRVVSHLAPRQALLVLDNCEHLVDACAELVDSILAAGPEVSVVATSREALNVPGERTWPIPPLPIPGSGEVASVERLLDVASVRLFAERAALARPGFTLTDVNAKAVALICRRLDGIPLAIELAAARVAALSPEVLSERLEHSLALLSRGSRTASPRQQTLTACIDWSYELLDEGDKALFRRLAHLPGGTTLEMAEKVCAFGSIDPNEVLDSLGSLVDKSLVRVTDRGSLRRYGMLETIRQFGLDELEKHPEEAAEVEDRHRAWWLEHAADADKRPATDDAPNVRQVLDELLAAGQGDDALRAFAALGDWWKAPSLLREGLGWAQRGLAAATDIDVRRRAAILATTMAWLADESRTGLEMAEVAAACVGPDDVDDLATIRTHEGLHAWRSGSFERARRAFEAIVADQRGDVIQALNMLGLITYATGDFKAARHWWTEMARRDTGKTSYTRTRMAILDVAEGHWDRAEAELATLLADAEVTQDPGWFQGLLARSVLADLRSELGDHEGALAAFGGFDPVEAPVAGVWAEGVTALDVSRAVVSLSGVHRRAGRLDEARAALIPALEAMVDAGARHAEAWMRCELARIELAGGDLDAADAEAERSIAIYDSIGIDYGWTQSDGVRAEVALARGQTLMAATFERRFIADHPGDERLYGYATCFERLADVAVAAGVYRPAGRLLGAAQSLRSRMGSAVPPGRLGKLAAARAAIETALGSEEADAVVVEGTEMSLEDALELARTFPAGSS
jgi:predicted ATPase/DNA-binding SARP family transcriptional activator/class 3 adenylate cyclase